MKNSNSMEFCYSCKSPIIMQGPFHMCVNPECPRYHKRMRPSCTTIMK